MFSEIRTGARRAMAQFGNGAPPEVIEITGEIDIVKAIGQTSTVLHSTQAAGAA
jgi:hypothetical protein